jgi:flagellar protein FlgJ
MDIGKVDSSLMSSIVKNAGNAAAQSASDDFAARLEAAARNNDEKELKKACQEFEALMLNMIYKQMKATVIKSQLVEEEPGREIFESMLDEELAEQASKAGGIGLADSLYKQLSRQYGRKTAAVSGNTEKNETPAEVDEIEEDK